MRMGNGGGDGGGGCESSDIRRNCRENLPKTQNDSLDKGSDDDEKN